MAALESAWSWIGPLVGQGPFIVLGLVLVGLLERRWPARRHANYVPRQLLRDAGAFVVVALLSKVIDPSVHFAGAALLEARPALPDATPVWLDAIGVVLLGDFLQYWVHRAMHRSAFLWRTHRWHHEPRMLTALAGYRGSVLHRLLFAGAAIVIPALVVDLRDPVALGVIVALNLGHDLFIHANLPIRLGPLARVVATPDWHRIHHGADPALHGANLGARLVIWDRLFGTYVGVDEVEEEFPLGVDASDVADPKGRVRVIVGV